VGDPRQPYEGHPCRSEGVSRAPCPRGASKSLAKRAVNCGSNLIFPSPRTGRPLSDMTFTQLLRDLGFGDRAHGAWLSKQRSGIGPGRRTRCGRSSLKPHSHTPSGTQPGLPIAEPCIWTNAARSWSGGRRLYSLTVDTRQGGLSDSHRTTERGLQTRVGHGQAGNRG